MAGIVKINYNRLNLIAESLISGDLSSEQANKLLNKFVVEEIEHGKDKNNK